MEGFYQLLGLAQRARKCVLGEENILQAIRNKKAVLVIVAQDASENTKKLYRNKCQFYEVNHVEVGDIASLSQSLGKNHRVAVAITDAGFSKGLLAKLTKKE